MPGLRLSFFSSDPQNPLLSARKSNCFVSTSILKENVKRVSLDLRRLYNVLQEKFCV